MTARTVRRIGVVGHGAIGSTVAAELAAGRVEGAVLAGVVGRGTPHTASIRLLSLDEALTECNVLVECAGQPVVAEHAEAVLDSGVDLLVTSIGALADEELASRLQQAGPGRLFLTSGAIGGLDLLSAAARMGKFERIMITTRKKPATLVQAWMTEEQQRELAGTQVAVDVFCGLAREAAGLFPRSLNVVAAVALAVGAWDAVTVRLVADPHAHLTRHHIEASGPGGDYEFSINNRPDPRNPRTSGVVPWAVLRSLESILAVRGGFA
ncbi:aspartate dehydrogenase domain-containing protein [Glutamicibacter sp. V16R2B1]|uniref:aspartate dehydrogenase domain-containing protein n=1 Tax=Glutamicibacter sp. V16R2B1 TaxID=2036207 RepID=UPI0010FE5A26|nr:aspartate dehydrogenase domain-containing protein [Glutamicibacter sp. V16R2B1]TLK54015.1 DUF108 domain-containing protein [Glutamicibacter sp. V16R2B1]